MENLTKEEVCRKAEIAMAKVLKQLDNATVLAVKAQDVDAMCCIDEAQSSYWELHCKMLKLCKQQGITPQFGGK